MRTGMCAFAIVMNKIFVKPYLAAGPPDGNTCPPFERTRPNLGEGGVSPGKGFDADTQNHLIDLFAYVNTRAHTAGFLCLQLSFILIGIQNCLVIFSSHVGYAFFDFLGGGEANRVKNTRNATLVYLILLVCINTYKMYLGGYYVATGIVLDAIKG